MRFLSVFFRFLSFAIIFTLVVAGIGREIWLFLGTQEVARQAQRLTQPSRWQSYYGNCRPELSLGSELPFRGMQVRFIDSSTFVTELDCVGQNALEVDRFTLPMGVKKTTGSAGFFYDPLTQVLSGEVTISFWGQNRVVYVDGVKSGQQWGLSEIRSDLPVSQCAGHGLKCCDAVESQGQGLPMSAGVLDCPGSCFDSCLRRPVLLSFQTDPQLEQDRLLYLVGSEQFATFAYTFDAQGVDVQSVSIVYGDGTEETSTTSSGQFEKVFECKSLQPCEFLVSIQATDSIGVVSAQTRLSTIKVILNPSFIE